MQKEEQEKNKLQQLETHLDLLGRVELADELLEAQHTCQLYQAQDAHDLEHPKQVEKLVARHGHVVERNYGQKIEPELTLEVVSCDLFLVKYLVSSDAAEVRCVKRDYDVRKEQQVNHQVRQQPTRLLNAIWREGDLYWNRHAVPDGQREHEKVPLDTARAVSAYDPSMQELFLVENLLSLHVLLDLLHRLFLYLLLRFFLRKILLDV